MAATAGIISGGISVTPLITVPERQAQESGQSAASSESARKVPTEPADRVTLLNKVQEPKQQAQKKADTTTTPSLAQPERMLNDILFSYNFRGKLRIRFMDSSNNVVYQTPPQHFARLSEIFMSRQTSVDTEV